MNTDLVHSRKVTEEDKEYLSSIFGLVNSKYFKGQLQTSVIWDVPVACNVVSAFEPTHSIEDDSPQYNRLKLAINLLQDGRASDAKKICEALLDTKDSRVYEVLIHVERRLNGDESKWAKLRNEGAGNITKQACSSTQIISGMNVIKVHPRLAPSNANKLPKYVLTYILRHEGLHQMLRTTPEDPHPAEFMEIDDQYDRKDQALEMLNKLGFSTL